MNTNNWKDEALRLAQETNLSWRKIAKELGVAKSSCSDHLRECLKSSSKNVEQETTTTGTLFKKQEMPNFTVECDSKEDNSRILLISDMHIPYHHQNTLEFLKTLKDKYSPTRVICLGDEMDKHALSFHDSDPNLRSAGDELDAALPTIRQLKELFPKMDILESNHGSLIYRKAKHHGIPRQYLKSYNDVLEVGEGWKWHYELTITLPDGNMCYFHHGKSADVLKLSQQMGMCAVQGHYHNDLSVKYWANPKGLYWALQTGCLLDQESLAFSYNNVNIRRPLIGTALIIDSKPIVEPMCL